MSSSVSSILATATEACAFVPFLPFQQSFEDPFLEPIINPGLWMGRWPLTHANKHSHAMQREKQLLKTVA